MNSVEAELSYRRRAVEAATPAGLVVILYDMLIGDLRRAISAMKDGDISARSRYLKHAFSILELLNGSLDFEHGGPVGGTLSQFYSLLRNQLLVAQFESDVRLLEKQMLLLLDVRESWVQADAELQTQPRDSDTSKMLEPSLAGFETKGTSQWIA